jgi:hypothetical protein
MVVRIAYCRDGSLGPNFDEMQNRSARNLQYEDWTEFVVVWRKDRLELYDDYVCAVCTLLRSPNFDVYPFSDCLVENGLQVTSTSHSSYP